MKTLTSKLLTVAEYKALRAANYADGSRMFGETMPITLAPVCIEDLPGAVRVARYLAEGRGMALTYACSAEDVGAAWAAGYLRGVRGAGLSLTDAGIAAALAAELLV